MAHVEPRCPDLLTGPNCSVTWREALKPGSEIVEGVLIFENGIGVLLSIQMALKLLWRLKRKDLSKHQKQGLWFRLRLVFFAFMFCFPALITYALGGTLEYQLSDVRGKISLICLLISSCFLYTGAGYILIMYIAMMNSKLRKANFIEQMDMSRLKKLAVPWLVYLYIFATICFILADEVEYPTHVVRIIYGATVLYPLIPTVVLHYYYFNKMANFLDEVTGDVKSISDEGMVKHLRKLARNSRFLGLYSICVGLVASCVCLYFAFTDITHDKDNYFFYQTFVGLASTNFYMGYLIVLRTNRGVSSSSSGKKATRQTFGTKASKNNTQITINQEPKTDNTVTRNEETYSEAESV